ncbi:MAG: hypothetical protein ABI051_05615 [Vicinamibacterales bacterium]
MRKTISAGVLLLALVCSGCSGDTAEPSGVTPIYNKTSGRLEQILSDRDGDGRTETKAFMDGSQLQRIEIDRNGDGRPDRWEYYGAGAVTAAGGPAATEPLIERADEANGAGPAITRRETYVAGEIARVEEDTDGDGRPDKWERYEHGVLRLVDLDLTGKGFADRRLTYAEAGGVTRVEADADGDGTFVLVPESAPVDPPAGRGGTR